MFHDDPPLTAQDVESGAYFQKARQWYSDVHHYTIAERSYYIIIITFAVINFIFAMQSFMGIFPLSVKVPFLTYSEDAWVDQPTGVMIAKSPLEGKNDAVLRYLLESYVTNREAYDLDRYELRYRNIASQSTSGVFDKYKESMDASNLYSPYRIYTNRFKRSIKIVPEESRNERNAGKDSHAHVVFFASVVNLFDGQEVKHSKFQVDIDYQYANFEIDQSLESYVWIARLLHLTGETIKASGEKRKVVPMKFVVSGYNVREMLE